MIVLDASAVVELLLRGPRAEAVERRLIEGTPSLHAPHLLTIEVAQVVRRYHLVGTLSEARGIEALQALSDLDVNLYAHEPLLAGIWARRANLTAYDAAYLALAEALDARLVTLDAALASSAGPVRVDLVH